MSPRMWPMAAMIAAPLPMLRGWRKTRMRGSAAASASRISGEPSRLPSSTHTSSIGRPTGLASTRATIVRSVRASLYTGIRMLRSGWDRLGDPDIGSEEQTAEHARRGAGSEMAVRARCIDGPPELAGVEPHEVARGARVDDDVAGSVVPVGQHRRRAVRAGDTPLQLVVIDGCGRDARRPRRAPPRREGHREDPPRHEDALAAFARL